MFKKLYLSVIFLVFLLFAIPSFAAVFNVGENEDMSIFVISEQFIGNRIGDVIEFELYIQHKIPNLKVNLESFPSNKVGVFNVRELTFELYENSTLVNYKIQTFVNPKEYTTCPIKDLVVYYTADKYWSALDNRYIQFSKKIADFYFHQTSIDVPTLRVDYIFDLFDKEMVEINLSLYRILFFLCLGLGLISISIILFDKIKKFFEKSNKQKLFEKIKNLNLDYCDLEIVCSNIRRIIENNSNLESTQLDRRLQNFIYGNKSISIEELKSIINKIEEKKLYK